MSFETGQKVIYDGRELCSVGAVCRKCFDGVHEEEYFSLIPENSRGSCYYVPVDKLEGRIRPLMTKEELFSAIDSSRPDGSLWCSDKNERRAILSETVKSGDIRRIISMIRGLLEEKERRAARGKGLVSGDEKALVSACKVIGSEFSAVFGIPEEDVGRLIKDRISGKK